jgi:AcrR family transcriptional regulator
MTEKQERILNTALELFATRGYAMVSTSLICKEAGVSEGLLFKHFGSKKGLLDAIMKDAEHRINQVFGAVLFASDPKTVILSVIERVFDVEQSEYDFWRLQYMLKWEAEYNNPDKMKPLIDKLEWAFESLGYDKPRMEAEFLLVCLDGIVLKVLRDRDPGFLNYKELILNKYS